MQINKINKSIIINILILLLSTINSLNAFSQLIDNDQAHQRVDWRQINTQNFRLIFPKEYEKTAINLASKINQLRSYSNNDFKISSKKIPIILQANHIVQNGFVQLAPRKTEFYPLPGGNASNVPWLENLALHELRHVAQMDKLSGNIQGPFLEQLSLAFYGLHLPGWFFEGDAVSTETQYSTGGRGRLPSWFMSFRTNELSGRQYSFDKNILGSYKDITPSFYTTGYLMNIHLTNGFGHDVKEKMLEDMRTNLIRPWNFQKALRKYSSFKNNKDLYTQTIDSLRNIWTKDVANRTNYPTISTENSKYPTHYLLPQIDKDKRMYVLYQSTQQITQIGQLENGKFKRLFYPGRQLTPHFHVNNNLIIWDEQRKNARFGKETFNVIHLYNVDNGQKKTFTFQDKLYLPTLSHDNKNFAAVKVNPEGISSLCIFDTHTKDMKQETILPFGLHIQQPKYDDSGEKIIAIGVTEEGTSLIEFDLRTNEYQVLLPWESQQIERPSYDKENIIFKAHYDNIDNIYRLNRTNGTVSRITNVKFGAFNPHITPDSTLLFNQYESAGNKIAEKEITVLSNVDLTKTDGLSYDKHLKNTVDKPLQGDSTTQQFDVQKYNTLSGLLNFHSLSLSTNNFESFDNIKPGIFWLANDVLNTSQLALGYEYDTDTRKSIYIAELNYSKYFPKFSLKYQNRGEIGQAVRRDSTKVNFDWREHYTTAEIQLPFSIYRQHQTYSFGFNVGTSYLKRYNVSIDNLSTFNEAISFPLSYQLYFNKNMLLSSMDLQPRWGQNFSVTYRHLPFEKELSGQILSLRTNFYFPGIMLNHGLQIRLSMQHKEKQYQYSNDIPMVSGFGFFASENVRNTLLTSYRLPLLYPDWSISALAYVKRIQGILYADYQNLHSTRLAPHTFGFGISADLNVFRYILPDINVSGRLTYINDNSATQRLVPTFGLSYSY